ncbi:membrane protein insertion efficiency factor YidD [Massilia sp. PAMC28688]|uniref:membrane protein insertion efficiency factor YidD n=1 Tax=Massilia sp. PAMC28688 TaxID=2861283 RepID=UPI001C63AAD1|nr:membrane protein insertion efficiency factor YidD [Massilia sp. PAMC28688]QYF94493.1 membrane protein insertion efficiency factor YidD [Massilia sp. PAMC28688]
MLTYLALAAIRLYQTVLSPYKGFRCAYAATTGCASCSTLGYRAIRRFGLFDGLIVLQWRFEECGKAYRRNRPRRPMALGHQRGDCDCGGCDAIDLDCCSCDLGWNKDKRSRRRNRQPAGTTWRRFTHELMRKMRKMPP